VETCQVLTTLITHLESEKKLYIADESTYAIHAVDTSSGQVVATIPTGVAWEVEAFPLEAGPFAYIGTLGRVAVVNVNTNSLVDEIPLGGGLCRLAIFPRPTSCYTQVFLPLVTRNYP
jgi:hypothetical protein